MISVQPIVVLIATRMREVLLETRSLPSLLAQSLRPDTVVLVNDGPPLKSRGVHAMLDTSVHLQLVLLENRRAAGVAGAWNTGLAYLWERGFRGFVAFLDDDDEWAPHHLEANAAAAGPGNNIVVSGLRMSVAGMEQPRPLITALEARDFLIGNPGWQGSNTFVDIALLAAVGGFRDGLLSLNDRDLAIRLLRHPAAHWALTGHWTATWHRDTAKSLSTPGSPEKLSGLRWFWQIYADELRPEEVNAFLERAERLFSIPRRLILAEHADQPPHRRPRGDWDVSTGK